MAGKGKRRNRPVTEGTGRRARRAAALLPLAALGGAVAWGVVQLLDPVTLPIRSVRIEGTFRHLSAGQLQRAVAGRVAGGFFSVDIGAIQRALAGRPWVAAVAVRRIWPDTLRIRVTEQVPAARWGSGGLINAHGEWFGARQDRTTAALPLLSGPPGFQAALARRYERINRMLEPIGRKVARLYVNERRAWRVVLDNGLELRLGRQDIDRRLRRFVRVYPGVQRRRERMAGVDLRYTNGFAVHWRADNPQARPPVRGS